MEEIIGIDSVVFIYLLEGNREYWSRAKRALEAVEQGSVPAVIASIGMVELLTGPKKQGRFDLARQYREYLGSFPNLVIKNMNESVVELASDLCARHNIRTVDAIHVATAIDFGAEKFITNDKGLKKIKEINVSLL
ncbi:MAG: PIN domain-containing protein, partial [Parcubacteria group bacterium]|nr:PIN domain-containing protein [Parcubacteria group bacterium]